MRKLKFILLLLIFGVLYFGCAPNLMKAKMAERDKRYDRSLEYALRHLQSNPTDENTIRFIEKTAYQYFEIQKAEILRLEKFESWQKLAILSDRTLALLQRVADIPETNFPRKMDLEFLNGKIAYSNQKRADELYNQAKTYFEQERYLDALSIFKQTQELIPNYKETPAYLKQCNSRLAEKDYQEGLGSYNKQDFTTAIDHFENSLKYQSNYKDAADYISRSKQNLANAAYQQGRLLMQQKNYRDALDKFQESKTFVDNFQDVDFQITRATTELANSIYITGEKLEENGQLQQAIKTYQEVLQIKPEHEEAKSKYDALLTKLSIRLAVIPFEATNLGTQFSNVATEKVIADIIPRKNEFLTIVDRENLEAILAEQALSQTGLIDETKAVEVGKLVGANFLLAGKINLVNYEDIPVTSSRKTAYYEKSYLDPKGVKRTRQAPFNYTQYERKRSVNINLTYRLINIETGQIEVQESFTGNRNDVASWVTCEKERVRDLPGDVKNRLNSPREPKARDVLIKEAIDGLTGKVADKIMLKANAVKE
ncbi:hypothetical protein JW964_25160 [candidate division KSB1 bacterium]|nr:hypothetical protein [candidate division KSB1 bacterium]